MSRRCRHISEAVQERATRPSIGRSFGRRFPVRQGFVVRAPPRARGEKRSIRFRTLTVLRQQANRLAVRLRSNLWSSRRVSRPACFPSRPSCRRGHRETEAPTRRVPQLSASIDRGSPPRDQYLRKETPLVAAPTPKGTRRHWLDGSSYRCRPDARRRWTRGESLSPKRLPLGSLAGHRRRYSRGQPP